MTIKPLKPEIGELYYRISREKPGDYNLNRMCGYSFRLTRASSAEVALKPTGPTLGDNEFIIQRADFTTEFFS